MSNQALAIGRGFVHPAGPRARVVYLNDLAGDLDGLFATAHFILSNSVDLRAIIGTGSGRYANSSEAASRAVEVATELVDVMGWAGRMRILAGDDGYLASLDAPKRSPAVEAILEEARRTDTDLPLYVAVGGGLTEVASALLIDPAIAAGFTLVWIGGGKPLLEDAAHEWNFGIDPVAAAYVMGHDTLPLWYVPSDAYEECSMSASELLANVAPHGEIGAWLVSQFMTAAKAMKNVLHTGDSWVMGDSPLVLLTALTDWIPSGKDADGRFRYQRTGSSRYIDESVGGRSVRRYTRVDTRLMFADFFAKLRLNGVATS